MPTPHKRFIMQSLYLNSLPPWLMNEVFYLRQNTHNSRSLNVFATNNPCNKFMFYCLPVKSNMETLPSEVKTVHHYNVWRTKSKLGAVIDISLKCAQGTLPMYAVSSFTGALYLTCGKIALLFKCKWTKCHFTIKTIGVLPVETY